MFLDGSSVLQAECLTELSLCRCACEQDTEPFLTSTAAVLLCNSRARLLSKKVWVEEREIPRGDQ